jgi:hypothetical protein
VSATEGGEDVQADQAGASTGTGVDRRTAMKAALGGAVAAAVWTAPRIEGLSVAPDYAAAATCTSGNMAGWTVNSDNSGLTGTAEDWGNGGGGRQDMGARAAGPFTINAYVQGSVNDDNGRISVTVNGIDPPFQRVVANVAGNCNNGGGFRSNFGTITFNTNGTSGEQLIDCQGGGNFTQADPNGQVRLNVSGTCL